MTELLEAVDELTLPRNVKILSDDAWLEILKKPEEAALELTDTEVKQLLRLLGVDDARKESA